MEIGKKVNQSQKTLYKIAIFVYSKAETGISRDTRKPRSQL